MQPKNRSIYLDVLKGIGILYVCIYHLWHGNDIWFAEEMSAVTIVCRFLAGILSICVPLFVTVNGAILLNKPFDAKKHYKGLLLMVIQYLAWRLISFIILAVYNRVNFQSASFLKWIYVIFLGSIEEVPLNHLWFIPALCCIHLLFPFFKKVFDEESTNRNARLSLVVLMCALFFFEFLLNEFYTLQVLFPRLERINIDEIYAFNPLSRGMIGTMSLYFLLGGYLHKYRSSLMKTPAFLCILAIVTGLTLSYSTWYIRSSYIGESFDNICEGYYTVAILLCTTAAFILASKTEKAVVKRPKLVSIVRLVGANTMSVYYLHWIIGYTVLNDIPLQDGFLTNMTLSLSIVLICSLAGAMLRKIPIVKIMFH